MTRISKIRSRKASPLQRFPLWDWDFVWPPRSFSGSSILMTPLKSFIWPPRYSSVLLQNHNASGFFPVIRNSCFPMPSKHREAAVSLFLRPFHLQTQSQYLVRFDGEGNGMIRHLQFSFFYRIFQKVCLQGSQSFPAEARVTGVLELLTS